ncbi:tryptophan synthase subunit alpha [Streptomyces sp. AC602_WCS936]|uniref:tryptophan synthase subunit alpha n=1 Tax=Streptomyces sp. AC602_WCS936 TaxID=2823685 RepID=UPI001C25DB4E|nr:tryptophan synthase subunit alpha [Streptomyces sp. AC602_WCS936]
MPHAESRGRRAAAAPPTQGFFPRRGDGQPGLAVFLNAGDPPLDRLPDLAAMLDDSGVECLELAVPFPDSVTDGPVVRRSARRALDAGTTATAVLDAVAALRPSLRRLRIALLADFGHTVKGPGLTAFTARAADAGCDGLLLHGLPPRLREPYLDAAARAALPVVATCYAVSRPEAVARAAADASAYVYLVAHYGRSGTAAPPDETALSRTIGALRPAARVPVAVGFGVRTAADVERLARLGADAAVIGSAAVARIEQALEAGDDPVTRLAAFTGALRPDPRTPTEGAPPVTAPIPEPAPAGTGTA